jgi:hypothetical protein
MVAPDGRGDLTEDSPTHHPWQHGLYVGMNDVNGVGFWLEGRRAADRATDGTFHPRPLDPPAVAGPTARWMVVTEWRAPGGDGGDRPGDRLLEETQAWQLADGGTHYALDLVWTLRASTDLTFGRHAYGGLFLRMPFRPAWGGTALSSEGAGPKEAEGQRARWMAVAMPLEGREEGEAGLAGVAILDHPANREHPVPWRVDNQLGIGPGPCIAGEWRLPRDGTTTARYCVLAFTGPIDGPLIEEEWTRFAAG